MCCSPSQFDTSSLGNGSTACTTPLKLYTLWNTTSPHPNFVSTSFSRARERSTDDTSLCRLKRNTALAPASAHGCARPNCAALLASDQNGDPPPLRVGRGDPTLVGGRELEKLGEQLARREREARLDLPAGGLRGLRVDVGGEQVRELRRRQEAAGGLLEPLEERQRHERVRRQVRRGRAEHRRVDPAHGGRAGLEVGLRDGDALVAVEQRGEQPRGARARARPVALALPRVLPEQGAPRLQLGLADPGQQRALVLPVHQQHVLHVPPPPLSQNTTAPLAPLGLCLTTSPTLNLTPARSFLPSWIASSRSRSGSSALRSRSASKPRSIWDCTCLGSVVARLKEKMVRAAERTCGAVQGAK